VSPYNEVVIASFRHKGLKQMFETDQGRLIESFLRVRVANILAVLDAASTARDLGGPGNRLHELKGNQEGVWSVVVSGNWRITFRFTGGNAHDVDLIDYP
jgi:proteic killer suppression protein